MKNFNVHKYKILTLVLLYVCFFLYGCSVYSDYGISVDEKVQRKHGLTNFKYVYEQMNGDGDLPEYLNGYPPLDEYEYRYYGIGIKIPLLLVEYLNKFQMTNQQIYGMNHFYTFLWFFIASIFVYKICGKLDMRFRYRVLAVLLFIICPRIIADSFYNIKDSIFLSLFVIMLYFALSILKKFNIRDAVGLAVSAAFCLNTRIIGALPLFLICIVYLVKDGAISLKRAVQIVGTGVVSFAVYIMITPASWNGVLDFVYHTVTVFSDYDSFDTVTLGKTVYKGDRLPWYYTILCICYTMPNFYLVSGIVGICTIIKNCVRNKQRLFSHYLLEFTILLQFLSVVLYDALLKPVKYNMWRHFYFLFIFIVLFSVMGVKYAVEHMGRYRTAVISSMVLSLLLTVGWNVKNHPYEYTYYNFLYAANLSDSMHHDYWAVSDMDLLKQVQDQDINLYPRNELTAMYFGEDGWEKYHACREPGSAEYKLRTLQGSGTKKDQNILYRTENKIEVDGRDISILERRINYDNCILKYVMDGNGNITGENDKTEIEWDYSSVEGEKCITAHLPELYDICEIDFLTSKELGIQNIRVYVSDNGLDWNRLNGERNIYHSKDLFAVLSEKEMPSYLMIRYETGQDCKSPDLLRYMIRVYGQEKKEFSGLYSDINPDDLQNLMDHDKETAWTSGQPQKKGMSIEIELQEEKMVKGMSIVSNHSDYSKDLSIQYQGTDGSYKDITYKTSDNEKYVFEKPVRCAKIRLLNQSDTDFYWWTIYELELDAQNIYSWSYKDTKNTVIGIQSPYHKDLLYCMTDNDSETIWTTEIPQSHDMYVQLELKSGACIKGFHIDAGYAVFENARGIKIYGSDNENDWQEIPYHYGSASDYVFDQISNFSHYRIVQTAEDRNYPWSVAQLGILRTE